MRSKYWISLLALAPLATLAANDDCKFRADRAAQIDTRGAEKILLRTGAGELKVAGRKDSTRVEATGVACAGKQEILDAVQIHVRREGNVIYVETDMPQDEAGWSWGDDKYATLDLRVDLPANLPIDAIDSSGEAEFSDLAALTLQDSSGELDLRRIQGALDVTDSSGEMKIVDAGSVRVRDSSGDIEIESVRGDVHVVSDSSGEMRIARVNGNVRVEQDSSGGIRIEDVKGSVTVDTDSSGEIHAARVGGNFTVGADSSGGITHESIGGTVSLPPDKY